MAMSSQSVTVALPVFYDMSGKRGRRVLGGTLLFVMLLAGIVSWITPQTLQPVFSNTSQAINLDQSSLQNELHDIPIIGEEGVDALARVDKVIHKNGTIYLADPFSQKIIREATENERDGIGKRNYVLEWYGHPPDHQLVLTFDDGPDPRNTPQILDILSREGVVATFFVVGNEVVKYPQLFKRLIREGHTAGNHTLSHSGFGFGSLRDQEEFVGDDRVMRSVNGYATRLFRIPEGDPDHNALTVLRAQQLGYLCVDMDYDTRDWRYEPSQSIPLPDLDGKGHVVLMHDGGGDRSATVRLLPALIEKAKSAGYTFTTPASFIDTQYIPRRDVAATLADNATWLALWAIVKLPALVVSWLFWFGVSSLSAMSLLYVVLAVINYQLQRRIVWPKRRTKRMPFVTIAIPAYNEVRGVGASLDALLHSDYPLSRLEIIVVDDGSTDGTGELLDEYVKNYKGPCHLKIIHQPNKGKSAALNHAFLEARGRTVITLDGDTLFEPQTVRMLARHFSDSSVGAVAGYVKVGNRRNLLTAWQSLEYMLGTGVDRMAGGLVNSILIVPGACSAWRRSAVRKAGGFTSDTLAEDCDLTLAVRKLGYRILQENRAVALTEAPAKLMPLLKQRKRWMYGNFQAFYKHLDMLFRPRYGMLGMVTLPYTLLSIIIPLIFMPFAYAIVILNLVSGDWKSVAVFGALIAGIYMAVSVVALVTVHERPWHLLIVPLYRLVYEPLRTYLLYASMFKMIRGKATKWYKPPRQGLVVASGK